MNTATGHQPFVALVANRGSSVHNFLAENFLADMLPPPAPDSGAECAALAISIWSILNQQEKHSDQSQLLMAARNTLIALARLFSPSEPLSV